MMVPLCASILALPARGVAPVQLIIDTDLGFDVDDVGAIAVAHALADQGHVKKGDCEPPHARYPHSMASACTRTFRT